MNDMKINESQVFDACALIEQIADMKSIEAIKIIARHASVLLNKALEEGEKLEENHSSLDCTSFRV